MLFGIDFGGQWLGVRIWIWLYLALSIFLFSFVVIYFYKEIIRKKYYEIRFPEKLLKIVIHFKSGYFKEYWRLIPEDDEFILDNRAYKFTDKSVLRDNDFFTRIKKNKIIAVIDGKEYDINDKLKLIKRFRSYPELHYFFNNPLPINFDLTNKTLEFSAKQMETFKENDLFAKLLTLDTERNMLMFCIVIGIVNLLLSVFIISKMMGWLDK